MKPLADAPRKANAPKTTTKRAHVRSVVRTGIKGGPVQVSNVKAAD